MKVALYARYSSENQRDASIADQFRVCREFAGRQRWRIEREYSDHAISGATLLRPGFQALMRDALRHEFDAVLAESLDRFSRDQEDTAGLFKRLTFVGVRIVTLAEGDITHLHIGFKGTMNALFLKDLAEKTHRGLRGRIEAGKSGGGLCYGYRVVRSLSGSALVNGDRQIEPAEAAIVVRVFREFVSGVSPKEMAKRLNREGVCGPGGGKWSPSTIHGHHARGTGILNNELYVGRLVWNRLRYVKDPDTGRRVSRPNPRPEWVTVGVPALRVVDDEMWAAVKERQERTRRTMAQRGGAALCQLRRPRYLFSGLTKCGECGAGFIMGSANRLMCFGAREQGTCTNRLTIRRDEVEARVLRAIQDKLLRQDLFEDFCCEFTREMNRLRMERRAELSSAERELAHLETRRKKLVQSIMDGVPGEEVKDEIISIAARREFLAKQVESADEPPPLLHPSMSDLYRAKVTRLAEALELPESHSEATEVLRGLIDEITLTPREGALQIDLKGNLAAMLSAAQPPSRACENEQRASASLAGAFGGGGNAKWRSSDTDDLHLQVKLVAGGGFEPPTFGL